MKFHDLIKLSLQSFKNRKSRMILTILGVAVAIGLIFFLVSLGYGLQRTILDRITTADSLLTIDVYPPEAEEIKLDTKSLETIAAIPGVTLVSPQAVLPIKINYTDLTTDSSANIIKPDFFRLTGIEASNGSLFQNEAENSIVINPVIAQLFALKPEELLNKKVTLTFEVLAPKEDTEEIATSSATTAPKKITVEKEFTIVGITNTVDENNSVYVPLERVQSLAIDEYQFVKVQVKDQTVMEKVREDLIGKGYLVSALSDVVDQANQIFGIIQIVLAVFGIFSLFVAAIGLINTMTISLLERTNEIGIMRAIGASAWDIKKIFLIESSLIGLFGGIAGIVIGIFASWLFNAGLNLLAKSLGAKPVSLFHTPLWFVIFIISFSGIVGFLSGVIPATKAGKLNALAALRYK